MKTIVSPRVWLDHSEKFRKAALLDTFVVPLAMPSADMVEQMSYTFYLFTYQGEQFGTFGHILGFHGACGPKAEAQTRVLCQSLVSQARKYGCSFLVGPMDGSTWHSYRCLDKHSSEPAFTLEPTLQLPSTVLRQSGFAMIASYGSAILALGDEVQYLNDSNEEFYVEALGGASCDEVLTMFYEAALEDFSANFFYRDIDQESFLRIYSPLKALLNLDFVLVARERKSGAIVGHIFAYGDQVLADRLVVKTVYVAKDRRGLGISRLLLNGIHRRAFEQGFKKVIHALIKSDNKSRQLSMSMGTQRFAEYSLWGLNFKGDAHQ